MLSILLLVLLPIIAGAQISISGKVINQTDTKPVAGASVFLSNTTIGTTTSGDGSFKLQSIKPGRYELIVSVIGFDPYKQTLIINKDINLPAILLFPKTIALTQVNVRAAANNAEREKYLDKFKAEFLGTSELAKQCKILNPELLNLNFDAAKNILKASSVDFLEIDNKGLGYKIRYLLNDFTLDNSDFDVKKLSYNGYVLFETLKGTPLQEKEWEKARSDVYYGSQMHFLRSAINNTLDGEGFRVLRLPLKPGNAPDTVIYVDKKTYTALKNQKPAPVISGPNDQGLYQLLNNTDRIYISYNKYHHFSTSRYTTLNEAGNTLVDFTATDALFDGNGALLDPKSLVYDGAWARNRVANLLPVDYEDSRSKKDYANAAIRSYVKKLKTYTDSTKEEKVYLHFDKPYYAVNDTIYLKAYVTGGGNGRQLSTLSGILNVDLIDPANKINKTIKLKLDSGVAWGDFVLPDSLSGGKYSIRAYTNWMRNEGDESFFKKMIPIAGSGKQVVSESIPAVIKGSGPKDYDVQFLPEGGTLVAGNYSKIAFKVIGANGLGADVKGTINDEAGNEVCKFESAHLGIGAFNMVPEPGKKYSANITFTDGSTRAIPIPPAAVSGCTLTINSANPDTIRLRVTAAAGISVSKLSLVAQSGAVVYYAAEVSSESRLFSAVIPKNRFPSGIVQFTLFSASGEPLNERLVFIEQKNQLKPELTADRPVYTARQKVNIRLHFNSPDNRPSSGSYSVAVIDENKVPVDTLNEITILTSLLLTSDLKGNIEQPNYYFSHPTDKTRADLDNLLLTQGYRHFTWKQLADTAAPKFHPEKGITISGTEKRNSKPVEGAQVNLFSKAGGMFMLDTVTDVNGKFAFKDLAFSDSTKFVVQSKVKKGQDDVTLELDTMQNRPLIVKATAVEGGLSEKAGLAIYAANAKQFSEEQKKYGINKHVQMLKEVTIKAKRNSREIHKTGMVLEMPIELLRLVI